MKLMIGGDLFLPDKFKADSIEIDPSLINLFKKADLSILNLESVICAVDKKIEKTGPHILGGTDTPALLRRMCINVVTLANNHILDYGHNSLLKTIQCLKVMGFETVGAGIDIFDAKSPYIKVTCTRSIAIINMAENEWASATCKSPGANPYDVIDCHRVIKAMRDAYKNVIVIIHGGHEYYKYPSPRMQKEFRFFVDSGASAVLCHHSHIYSGMEVYNNSPIFYGLGNFYFPLNGRPDFWRTGLVIELDISENQQISFKTHFISSNSSFSSIKLLSGFEHELEFQNFTKLNKCINDKDELNSQFNLMAQKVSESYLYSLHPLNRKFFKFLFIALRKLKLINAKPSNYIAANILNRIRCESHSDVFTKVLKNCLTGQK